MTTALYTTKVRYKHIYIYIDKRHIIRSTELRWFNDIVYLLAQQSDMLIIPVVPWCDKVRYHADTKKYNLIDRSIVHI